MDLISALEHAADGNWLRMLADQALKAAKNLRSS
jgi:hypothetical protein